MRMWGVRFWSYCCHDCRRLKSVLSQLSLYTPNKKLFRHFDLSIKRKFYNCGFTMTECPKFNKQCMKKSSLSGHNLEYEEAIKSLNGLQSNAAVLEEMRKKGRKAAPTHNLIEVQKYLGRVGVLLTELDKLPVIHVAGTKGKGSTCAFVEGILREHGLRTGFYSSPHLVAVRERIRLNGIPISKEEFSHYFWDVYSALLQKKDHPNDMPQYFKFLTVLALKIFIKEEVDVAILEVGIGGEYDCTNVIRCPVVCGISSLGIDHTLILGDTIGEIAWHKAGIMKPNSPTFTVDQQPPEALQALRERAKEKQVRLFVSPPLEQYGWGNRPIHLGLTGYVQFLNASLALQLSQYFMKSMKYLTSESKENISRPPLDDGSCGKPFVLSEEDVFALENVVWPGRSQVMIKGHTTFFIDGAHTSDSIQSCIDWFGKMSVHHGPKGSMDDVCKVLMFNLTGDRNYESFLCQLYPCNFDVVIFTTNLVTREKIASSDQTNFTISDGQQITKALKFQRFWFELNKESDKGSEPNGGSPKTLNRPIDQSCLTFECIKDALLWLSGGDPCYVAGELSREYDYVQPKKLREAPQIQVLVTGSLHLVGGVLAVLDPALSQDVDGKEKSSIADLVKRKYAYSQFSTPGAP